MTGSAYVHQVGSPLSSLVTGVVVAVPTIADAESDEVAVDVSASGFQFTLGLGDAVLVAAEASLPTSCLQGGAYVSAADEITISFGTLEGGAGVTGANVNYAMLAFDTTT